MRAALRAALPPLAAFAAGNALWEVAVRLLEVPLYLLPPPSRIATALATHAGTLAGGVLLTGQAALAGFALAGAVGVAVGAVIASFRWVERAVYPFTVLLQTVPLVAIAPLLVVWFGYGVRPVAVAAFIVAVFPVIVNTVTGLRSVDPHLVDLFRLYGAGFWARLYKLRLPAALPNVFAGLKVAAGLAVIGAVVGEFVASYAGEQAGLGMLALTFARESHLDRLFAAVGLASLLGLALFAAVGGAARLTLRHWHASEQERP